MVRRTTVILLTTLAVTVDDADQSARVRGADLLDTTPASFWLYDRPACRPGPFQPCPRCSAEDGERLASATARSIPSRSGSKQERFRRQSAVGVVRFGLIGSLNATLLKTCRVYLVHYNRRSRSRPEQGKI